MSTRSPQVGEFSPDGQFRWDGQQWAPVARAHREPTSWTIPMQRIAAAYMLLSPLVALATNVLFETRAALERSVRASSPQLSSEQVQASVAIGYAFGWALVGVLVVGGVVLAVGSYRGWRWAFWADLVVLVLGAVQVITNSAALLSSATQVLPSGAIALELLLSLVALALLVWFIVAAARYGPWAMRRPGT